MIKICKLVIGVFLLTTQHAFAQSVPNDIGLMFRLTDTSSCFLAGFAHHEMQKREIQNTIKTALSQSDRFFVEAVAGQTITEKVKDRNFESFVRDDVVLDMEINNLNELFAKRLKPFGNWSETTVQLKSKVPSHSYGMFIQATGRALRLKESSTTYVLGVDSSLLQAAQKMNLPVIGLESESLHTDIWYSNSDTNMRRQFLVDNYKYALREDLLATEKKLQDAIYRGNYDEFESLYFNLYEDLPALKVYGLHIVQERNKFWIDKYLTS